MNERRWELSTKGRVVKPINSLEEDVPETLYHDDPAHGYLPATNTA
jgi:hypothetical protein